MRHDDDGVLLFQLKNELFDFAGGDRIKGGGGLDARPLLPLLLPGMNARKWGRFIALGLCPPYNSPDHAYNVGKAARTAAMQVLRQQVAGRGVTVNTIAPGDTPGYRDLSEAIADCAHGPSWQQRARTTPQDIAEGVAFLCSDAGAFLNGMILAYD
jgi:NAD(P)-dependent dehydrogenase (short-subunit alcohol dehydrogenase family)